MSWASANEIQHHTATSGTNQGADWRKGRSDKSGRRLVHTSQSNQGPRKGYKPAAAQTPPPSIANPPAIGYKQENKPSPASGP